jgi:hypothetical protein
MCCSGLPTQVKEGEQWNNGHVLSYLSSWRVCGDLLVLLHGNVELWGAYLVWCDCVKEREEGSQ